MKKKIAECWVGIHKADIYVMDTCGSGEIYFPTDDDSNIEIRIGICGTWDSAFTTLIHELMEITLLEMNKVYVHYMDESKYSTDNRMFMFDHSVFGEMCQRIASPISYVSILLKEAWKEYHSKKKVKKKKRKKK